MVFQVDHQLVAPSQTDSLLGIRYATPRLWQEVRIPAGISQQGRTLKYAYTDSVSRATMLISDLSQLADSTLANELHDYIHRFNSKRVWKDLRRDDYQFNGLLVNQVLMRNDSFINLRLVLRNSYTKPVQVDYVLPMNTYNRQSRAVESSIGSFFPIHN